MQRVRDRIESFKEERVIDGQKPHKKLKKIELWVFSHPPYARKTGAKKKIDKKKRRARIYKTGDGGSERYVKKNSKKRKDELEFIRNVLVHPRHRLIRKTKREKLN